MSSTAANEVRRIRRLLSDRQLSDPVVPGSLLEELLADALDELSTEFGGDVRTTSFASVGTTGRVTITTPGTYPNVRFIRNLIRQSDGLPLEKTTHQAILDARAYGVDSTSVPQFYCVRTEQTGAQVIEVYPAPASATILDAIWEPIPEEVVSIALTTPTINFSPTGLRALRARVAGRALSALAPEELAKLGRTPQYAQGLLTQSQSAAADEWQRVNQDNLQDHIVRARR